MEYGSRVESYAQHDSGTSIASRVTSQKDISPEGQILFQTLTEAIIENAEENSVFTKEISNLLRKLGLEINMLSDDVKDGLEKVSLVLRSEGLQDLDETALRIVRLRKDCEEKKKEREERKLISVYNNLSRNVTTFSRELESLENCVISLKSTIETAKKEEEESCANYTLSTKKIEEYQKTIEKLEGEIEELGIKDLYPEKILGKYDKYLELSGELMELNKSINQYNNLPPNLHEAKVLLEAKQKEYDALEHSFLEKLGSTGLE